MISRPAIFVAAISFVAAGFPALFAQDGSNLAAKMAENARLLRRYTFKQRTEVFYNGERQLDRVTQIHFGPDGRREQTVVSETGPSYAPDLGDGSQRAEIKRYAERVTA
jgi:hypothetical protein